jgi:hypothetical protein
MRERSTKVRTMRLSSENRQRYLNSSSISEQCNKWNDLQTSLATMVTDILSQASIFILLYSPLPACLLDTWAAHLKRIAESLLSDSAADVYSGCRGLRQPIIAHSSHGPWLGCEVPRGIRVDCVLVWLRMLLLIHCDCECMMINLSIERSIEVQP